MGETEAYFEALIEFIRAARFERRLHVSRITRIDNSNRKLAILGGIRRVKRARTAIEQHVAADCRFQPRLEFAVRREALMIQRREVLQYRKCRNTHGGMVARFRTLSSESGRPSFRQLPIQRYDLRVGSPSVSDTARVNLHRTTSPVRSGSHLFHCPKLSPLRRNR